MADMATTLTSTLTLLGTASFMIVVAYICQSFSFFRPSVAKNATIAKVAIGIILGLLAIFGTEMGSKLPSGAIVNVRSWQP